MRMGAVIFPITLISGAQMTTIAMTVEAHLQTYTMTAVQPTIRMTPSTTWSKQRNGAHIAVPLQMIAQGVYGYYGFSQL